MLKNLLILSVLSFSVFAQAEVSLAELIKKDASVQEIQALLQAGADVNAKDEDGRTALIAASTEDNPEMVRLLLQAGASVNVKDKKGRTALFWVPFRYTIGEFNERVPKKLEVAKLLLQAGADVNVVDKGSYRDGYTILMSAAYLAYVDIVKLLLQYGADVNARDEDGKTALTYALTKTWGGFITLSKQDKKGTVQALLQAGAVK